MNYIHKFSRWVNSRIEILLFIMGVSMSAIVAAQVFSRYVLNHSIFWSEELARYLLVWLTFLGSSVAYKRKVHPGIDMVYGRLPKEAQRLSALLVHLVSMCLFGIMIHYGCAFSWFVRLQISPALSLPKWVIFAIIPVSGAVLFLHCLSFIAEEMGKGEK